MKGVCGSVEKVLSVVEASQVEFQVVDSLQKIFMSREPLSCPALYELSAMKGETVSFQAAYWDYPRNAQFLIRLRERVNREIEENM